MLLDEVEKADDFLDSYNFTVPREETDKSLEWHSRVLEGEEKIADVKEAKKNHLNYVIKLGMLDKKCPSTFHNLHILMRILCSHFP